MMDVDRYFYANVRFCYLSFFEQETSSRVSFDMVSVGGSKYWRTIQENYCRCYFSSIGTLVVQFRDSVKTEHSNKLSSVDAADVLVYKKRSCIDKRNDPQTKEEPLKEP
jgi:hypothetical protein